VEINVGAFLRRLRATAPGCSAVALVDLDTNMVLTEVSEPQVGQEFWDALALKAIDVLVGGHAQSFAETLASQQSDYIQYAKLRRGDEVFLLIRSQAEPPLGVLLIGDQRIQTDTLVEAAREELEALAATN
jgi:hypothetical protein